MPGEVADRRARSAQRHNTQLLDVMLGVDEPVLWQRNNATNRVPVLLLRQYLLSDASPPRLPVADFDALLAGYDADTELPFVLCSFAKTLAHVQTRRGRALVQRRVLRRRATLERLYHIDVPDEVVTNGRACAVALAALLRVAVASDLLHEVRNNVVHRYTLERHVQHYEFQLQLFIDTHLDLFVGAAVRGAWDDDALCEPMSVQTTVPAEMLTSGAALHEILQRSVVERCYPHALRASSAGEMPDLSNSTLSTDLWTKASDNTRSRVSELLHNIGSKTGNHRCSVRNFAKMVCQMWGSNRPTLTLVTNILELHSLGNYPGLIYRPAFRARCAVRRSYSLDELEPEPWCAWCHYESSAPCPLSGCNNCATNKRPDAHKPHICAMCTHFARIQTKLYAAMREFSIFVLHSNVVVERMMRVDNEHTAYGNVVRLAADESRAFTQQMFASRVALSAAELAQLAQQQTWAIMLAQQCNKSVQRLRKDYLFAELLCRWFNFAQSNIVCETWSGAQQPESYLMAPRERNYEPFQDKRLERMNVCFAPLAHLGGRRWCDVFSVEFVDATAQAMLHHAGDVVFAMLHLVGVSPACHTVLRDLQRKSVIYGMPDNSLKAACVELCKLFPVDFHIVHLLLRRICFHDQFAVMVMDERAAVAQTKALRERHAVMPWQRLPESVERLYFCGGCFNVFADLVEPLSEELVQRAVDDHEGDPLGVTNAPFGAGPKGAMYSHKTRKLHCTRPQASSTVAKKYERDGMMSDGEFFGDAGGAEDAATARPTTTDKRVAKSLRAAQQAQADCSAPLKFVSMVGKLARIGSRFYALCCKCAAPFVVDNNSLTNTGFECGRHTQIGDANSYTELRDFVSRHTHEMSCSTANGESGVVPLIERYTTTDRYGKEKVHKRIKRVPIPLCPPSHVQAKSPPIDKLYCVGTPCFSESTYKQNVELLSWAAQLGRDDELSTRDVARRLGTDNTADAMAIDEPVPVDEKVEARHISEAAAAAAEAARVVNLGDGGMTLEQAERMSNEAVSSGRCLLQTAITCAFCYARCERNGCFTRVNIIDVNGLLVEPLWQRKIEARGRVDVWLCKRDFDKVQHFLRHRPLVMASDLWDALVEMQKRTFSRRLAFLQGRK